MCASENKCIGAPAVLLDETGGDIGQDGGVIHALAAQKGLGARGKLHGRMDDDFAIAGKFIDQSACVIAFGGSGGCENSDDPGAGCFSGGFDRGDRADKGRCIGGAERRQDEG